MIPIFVVMGWGFVTFLGGLALGVFVGRAFRFRGNIGEALIANAISDGFQRPHVLLNNVTLENRLGTTQIDHILVADTGIFVIETKHYSGWIFGHPDDPQWTQVIYTRKSRFQNPIRQNYGHVKALQAFLSQSANSFIPLVVFTGDATFKSVLGPTVLKLTELTAQLSAPRPILFDQRTLAYLVGCIEMNRMRRSLETDEYHLNAVRRRVRSFKP